MAGEAKYVWPKAGKLLVAVMIIVVQAIVAASGTMEKPTSAVARQLITIDAILQRGTISADNVQWIDGQTLSADFQMPHPEKAQTRLLSLSGILSEAISEGDLTAVSPDRDALIRRMDAGWVLDDRASDAEVMIVEPKGETRKFTAWSVPLWSQDGRFVVIVEYDAPGNSRQPVTPTEVDGVQIVDYDRRKPLTSAWVTRLTVVDREKAIVLRRLYLSDLALRMEWGSANVLYVAQTEVFAHDPHTRIYTFAPSENVLREIYSTEGRMQSMKPAVQPNGELLAITIDADNRAWGDFVSLVLVSVETGEETSRLTHELPIAGDDYHWSVDGSRIYARVRHGGFDEIWAIPLEGKPRPLAQGPRRHFGLDLSPDGRKLSYQTADGHGRKDIRVLDLETGEEKVVLVLDEPVKEFELGGWRQISWKSSDRVQPYGFIITPPNFTPTHQYPMLVYVHGGGPGSRLYLHGPFTRGVAKGPLEWHTWAAMGYVVFIPDYRSTGAYGPKVIANRYREGELSTVDDSEDIVSGVRHVIKEGFIDPARIAILGHSAGAARVYVILTQDSDIFAAAILNEGIAPDPVSSFIQFTTGTFVGGYPVGALQQRFGGKLAEVPERYKKNLIFDAYRVKTPTLILMGNEERGGVAHLPYEVVYSILKTHGVPTRMLSFVEEGHVYNNSVVAGHAFDEAQQWLATHMPPQEE